MEDQAEVQEQEQKQEPVVAGKKKHKDSGNLIQDVAQEVENLTKVKALNLAANLADSIDTNYFKLGGVLKVIRDNAWFENYESFGLFVYEKFGFQERKAKYLIEIYENLVEKQIPWEKVAGLGWTKLKDLARVLTQENVDEWVEKAGPLTVVELQALLKGSGPSEGGDAETKDDVYVLKFKVQADKFQTISQALNKAKAEIGTDYDNVALETICMGYLGGSVSAHVEQSEPIEQQLKALGPEKVLEIFGELWPEIEVEAAM